MWFVKLEIGDEKLEIGEMDLISFNQYFGNIDIYLLDQILKNRFHRDMKVLDAGCGEGRNLIYFLNAGYTVYGIDKDGLAIEMLRFIAASTRPDLDGDHFSISQLESLPFEDGFFDLVICSAVLHFAENEQHFITMFRELSRCAKPGGMLFIRTASDMGIEEKIIPRGSGKFLLPDGSVRFLLTRTLLNDLIEEHSLSYLEPFKTVNVNDTRCMSTLVLSVSP